MAYFCFPMTNTPSENVSLIGELLFLCHSCEGRNLIVYKA